MYLPTLAVFWQSNSVNAATGAPTHSDNGLNVPSWAHGRYTHLIAQKENVADLCVWGMTQLNTWLRAQPVSFAATVPESQLLQGVSSFKRLYVQRLDANVANRGANIGLGWVGHGG